MKTKLLFSTMLLSAFTYAQTIELEEFADGFTSPVELVHAGDSRMFVVEQGGIIKILNADGTTNATPFLNISGIISAGGERGLLGLAFHPDYATNRYFFVNYTNPDGHTVIARYTASVADPSVADQDSQMVLMTVNQPFGNHNGGCLRFGPDGYLYIAMGDGGSGGDPGDRAQNMELLLGKMLRIDVDNGAPYGIPADNPFVDMAGADEIWASGLRNPWKFSFNRDNDDLWIADVGQGEVEEINKVTSTEAGLNYGWRCYEGSQEFNTAGCSDNGLYNMPFAEYSQDATGGCSVTGGYVYTGNNYPNLEGKYLFSDLCHNKIGVVDTAGNITLTEAFDGNGFVAFGEDMGGELFVAGIGSGIVYRIIDSSLGSPVFNTTAVSIYPNPADEQISLTVNEAATLSLFDMNGKLLLKQQVAPGQTLISTSALHSGIYMMEVESISTAHREKLVIR